MDSGVTPPASSLASDVPNRSDSPSVTGVPAFTGTDLLVSVAFSLGWQVAELYQSAPTIETRKSTLHELPDIGSFAVIDRRALRLDQINSAVTKLGRPIKDAGLTPPGAVDKAEAGGEEFLDGVLRLHVELLTTLTAADFRLGKAYGLGRALFETCLVPDQEWFEQALEPVRLGNLYSWLLDLKTVLPDHAGECVYKSLQRWEDWGQDKKFMGGPFEWERHHTDLGRTLGRQGEIWRALISGEKQATDTLTTARYVEVAGHVFQDGMQLLIRLPRPLWLVVGIALLLTIGGLIAAAIVGNVSSVVAALAGVAAALGISWAGVKNALGTAVSTLQKPLWGAALDLVIVDAITRVDDLAKASEPARPALPSNTPRQPGSEAADPPMASTPATPATEARPHSPPGDASEDSRDT